MSNDNDTTDTVVPFRVVTDNGDKAEPSNERPQYTYQIVLKNGTEFTFEGFLIFTSAHVAIMKEVEPDVAAPVFVVPLTELSYAGMVEDDDAPF